MGIAYAVGSDSQGKLFRRILILCTEACHEVLTTGATFIALRAKPVKSNALTLHCEPSGKLQRQTTPRRLLLHVTLLAASYLCMPSFRACNISAARGSAVCLLVSLSIDHRANFMKN